MFDHRVVGSGFVLNGAGEVAGLTQVMEWGLIETPILLTNTLSVGTCIDALRRLDGRGRTRASANDHDVIIPVVGECDDSWLNDVGRPPRPARARLRRRSRTRARARSPRARSVAAPGWSRATSRVASAAASRRLPVHEGGYTIGVLVMSNFGHLADLRIGGAPVGMLLDPESAGAERRIHNDGSIIAVVATDAPLLAHQVQRLCKRVALGIGRAGS